MIALLCFFLTLLASPFKSKSRLEAENVALRRQLTVLRRKVRGRVHLSNGDRLFFVQLYRWFPSVLKAKRCEPGSVMMCAMASRFFPACHFVQRSLAFPGQVLGDRMVFVVLRRDDPVPIAARSSALNA